MTALDAVQAVWSALQIGDCRSVSVTCPIDASDRYQLLILLASEREVREAADRAGWPTIAVSHRASVHWQARGTVDEILVLLSYQDPEAKFVDDAGVVL